MSTKFQYQRKQEYFGQIAEDLKDLAREELEELGVSEVIDSYRGLYFKANRFELYNVLYKTRLFSRILAPITFFDAHDEDYLYKRSKEIEWDQFISVDQTFSIHANVGNSNIRHSKFASLRLKDAICDYFREKYGRRPDVDRDNPDLSLNLFVNKNQATINVDLGGGALHKRAYRQVTGDAPIAETLAAAMIRHSGWDGECPLYDPMCGSGTIAIEAMLHYCRIPSGSLRKKFSLFCLPDFSQEIWDKIVTQAHSQIRPLPENLIFASDASTRSLEMLRTNMSAFKESENIEITQSRFQDLTDLHNVVIVTNPPYGIRLNGGDDMKEFVGELGDFLKQQCTGTTAWVYFGERQLIRNVGLRASRKIPMSNGGLDGRLAKFEMYAGTKNP